MITVVFDPAADAVRLTQDLAPQRSIPSVVPVRLCGLDPVVDAVQQMSITATPTTGVGPRIEHDITTVSTLDGQITTVPLEPSAMLGSFILTAADLAVALANGNYRYVVWAKVARGGVVYQTAVLDGAFVVSPDLAAALLPVTAARTFNGTWFFDGTHSFSGT